MGPMRSFDLCVIGSGSGNSILDERFLGQRVALVDKGTFGGTCLNVGCIPTKMFVYPADLAAEVAKARRLGVGLRLESVDWPGIRDRIFGRIDPISAAGKKWRVQSDNVTLLPAPARFTGERRLEVRGEEITAEKFVLAAGSRAVIPPIEGIDQVTVHTSDTVMRVDALPERLLILGGGYISAEFAHVFASFGVNVTVVNRGDGLLLREDEAISSRFTELMAQRVSLRLGTRVRRLSPLPTGGVRAELTGPEGSTEVVAADLLLVATGRVPNADLLNLPATGVEVDADGYVVVDEEQRTTAPNVWALGDVSSHYQLKHVANAEARVVQHNLLHPDEPQRVRARHVPHAIFTWPQIAAVGLTEAQARDRGLDYVTATQPYSGIAYGWAMEDEAHFAKLITDPATGQLLGAHILGPQASVLIQPIIQAMEFGVTAHDMARGQYWIHPALTELIENALLALKLR